MRETSESGLVLRRVGIAGALVGVLFSVAAPPALADLNMSAWMLVIHDAATRAEADAWAERECQGALEPWCDDAWADGALGEGVGIYNVETWPGATGGPWLVAAGLVRLRAAALVLRDSLDSAGYAVRVERINSMPRIQEWAHGIAGQWRLWTVRGPETQQEVLYLSRDGKPDIEIARGWPLPKEDANRLYPIGRQSEHEDAYYFFSDGHVLRVDATTGEVAPTDDALTGIEAEVRAVADAYLGADAPITVEWALPFAAGATTAVDGANGPDASRQRFLVFWHGADGWKVVRDEVQPR